MKLTPTVWALAAALGAAGIMIAQAPAAGQGKGKAPKNPEQSPASAPRPKTATPQAYTEQQIRAGELRFTAECGFCHGRDATGGESGPDLTRSEIVAEDVRGDKIAPLVRAGIPDEGMPAFTLSDADMNGIVAFIHTQMTKFESMTGGRRTVAPEDLLTGNAADGRAYFNGAGGCTKCHSATGDLAGVGSRFQGLALMQRMLYPGGRPAPARPKASITLASGETINAPLAGEDEFSLTIQNAAGERQTYAKIAVKYTIDDPMSAHFEQLGKYTDDDMHNVYAYLNTLK